MVNQSARLSGKWLLRGERLGWDFEMCLRDSRRP